MSTLIGSGDTNIYLESGRFEIRVGGDLAMQVITDPSSLTPGQEFATKQYADSVALNDLAN